MGPNKDSNTCYHLAEFRRVRSPQQRLPQNLKEKFNFLHSSCKNIVECTFGVWKARFLILKHMPNYDIDTQTEIVLATMAIHNYIRKKYVNNNSFELAETENYVPSTVGANSNKPEINEDDEILEDHQIWMEVRNKIARHIAQM
ncbi:hypothetical protein LIER_40087 [Lithospermum erythrorhizon]|uniref:DDE Tnp4 domain-containing protein n=1 Tax=Lithospermum erythrorhizon TaxID=34254 RepID=A0AAV3QPD0_LITER